MRPGRNNPWILTYHYIDPKTFENHLRCITRFYKVITLDSCYEFAVNGKSVPPNSIVLTFDDGLEQIYSDLYLMLQRYQAPATVFLTTDPVDSGVPLWFYRLKAHFHTTQAESVTIGDVDIPLNPDREAAYISALGFLNRQSTVARDQIIRDVLNGVTLPDEAISPYNPLNWDQIKAMHGLITYGGHTVTHPFLAGLDSNEAQKEIQASKNRIEEVVGVTVKHFAYPFGWPGSFTHETKELLKNAGFFSAVTTIRAPCKRGDFSYDLPRIGFNGGVDGRMVACRLSGLWVFLST